MNLVVNMSEWKDPKFNRQMCRLLLSSSGSNFDELLHLIRALEMKSLRVFGNSIAFHTICAKNESERLHCIEFLTYFYQTQNFRLLNGADLTLLCGFLFDCVLMSLNQDSCVKYLDLLGEFVTLEALNKYTPMFDSFKARMEPLSQEKEKFKPEIIDKLENVIFNL